MPIKAGQQDASLTLWNFSQSNKHCIHLSTKTIYFPRFIFAMPAFALIEISYSNTTCNKSTAEALMCLIPFYGGEWWRERLHCHMHFPLNNHFLH